MSGRSLQPCGCVVLTDDTKTIINDVDMSHMVANIRGAERCAVHEAEWNKAMEKFVADMKAKGLW